MSGRPLEVLEDRIGDAVTVRLKDGEHFAGILDGFDNHLNVVLEPVEEGAIEADGAITPVDNTTIIRGDNIVSIHP